MSVTKKLCLRATFDLNEQPRRGDETAIVLLIEVGWLWQKVLGTTVCFYPCASEDVKEGISIAVGPLRMALFPGLWNAGYIILSFHYVQSRPMALTLGSMQGTIVLTSRLKVCILATMHDTNKSGE